MHADRLWGGTIVDLSLDVPNQEVTLAINVSHGSEVRSHILRFIGVSEFRFFNTIEHPWDYAEVTEIHLERQPSSEKLVYDIVLWSEDAGLSGVCSSVTLDGLALT